MSDRDQKGQGEKTVVSAVITSQKRKIQLEFPDNRAATANTAITGGKSSNARPKGGNKVVDSNIVDDSNLRPSTHEGLVPAPPAGMPKRSAQRAISARQINFTLAETEFQEQALSAQAPTHVRPASKPAQELLDDSIVMTSVEDSEAHNKRQKVGWPKINPDLLVPTFIKPSTAASTQRPQTSGGGALPHGSQYAPLSHRLRANMSITPYQHQVDSHQQQAYSAIPPVYNNAMASQVKDSSTTSSESVTIISQYRQNNFFDKLRKQHSLISRKNRKRDDASRGSVDFLGMEFEDILQYLLDKYNENPSKAEQEFIHVTPKHYLSSSYRYNIYDLVALDRPGNPKSGYVWTRESHKYSSFHHSTLPKDHVMQFSLSGLLMTNARVREENDVIPLKEFLMEKEQVSFLHTGRFFGLFKEFHIKNDWKFFLI